MRSNQLSYPAIILRFAGAKVLLFLELPKFLCKNFIFREKSCNFATVNITFARLLAAWPQPRTFIDTPYMKKERLNLEYPLTAKSHEPEISNVVRLCDIHNIPIATNLASAELLIKSLERGDLEWREMYK